MTTPTIAAPRSLSIRDRMPLLLVALAALSACTSVQLAVRPVQARQAVQHERPCASASDPLACLAGGRPDHRLRLAPGEQVDWIKASDDGGDLVVAVRTRRGGERDPGTCQLAAVDAVAGREKWRVELDETGVLGAREAYFLDSTRVVLVTEPHPSLPSTLVSLDRRNGQVLWRYPSAPNAASPQASAAPAPQGPVSVLLHDKDNGFLVVEVGGSLTLVDAAGQTVASMKRLDDPERGFGASAYLSGDDIFVVDLGLVRIDRKSRRFVWASQFATYTYDPHTGANAGRIIGSVLLSVLTIAFGQTVNLPAVPPDFLVGLVTEPITSGTTVCMGAMSGISCFDRGQGRLLWSRRFGVLQFQGLVASSDRLYALSGGRHVHVRGRQPIEINEGKQSGLFSLRISDGDSAEGFASPFGRNVRGTSVSAQALAAEDPKQAADAAEKMSAALAGVGFPLFGLRLTKAGLLVFGLHKAALLDPRTGGFLREADLRAIGPVVAVASAGADRLLVRGAGGLATFDESSGALVWMSALPATPAWRKLGDPGAHRLLQVPTSVASSIELDHFKAKVFWPLPKQNLVLVPTAGAGGTELAAVRLSDGATVGRLAIPGRVSVLAGKDAQFVVVDANNQIDLFRLPVAAPPAPPAAAPVAADAAPTTSGSTGAEQ